MKRLQKTGSMWSFTLLELLVTISIMIILASLLLPSLGRAREKSREIICLSNLQQCGIGMLQYCNDNNGWTTCFIQPWSGYQWGRCLMVQGYLPGNDPNALQGKTSIAVCPSTYPNGKYLYPNYTYGIRIQNDTYTFYQLLKGHISCMFYYSATDTYTPHVYSNWANPASVHILADTIHGSGTNPGRQWYYYYWNTPSATCQLIQTRHSRAANMWFADGHVGPLSQNYFLENNARFFDSKFNLL